MVEALSIEVIVMIFGKIVDPAPKQSDDPIGGMRVYFPLQSRTGFSGRLRGPFRRLATFDYGQLNSLSIFKPHFTERLKDAIFVESFHAFCHLLPRSIARLAHVEVYRAAPVLSNSPTRRRIALREG